MAEKKSTELAMLGWRIPEPLKDAFIVWCDLRGGHYGEECAGALFLWQYLPAELREWAKLAAKGEGPAADKAFWEGFAAEFRSIVERLRSDLEDKRKPNNRK